MNNKTDCYNCNEDDFVQAGEQLNELTVTITLCEYRNMVRELARMDAIVDQLKNEKSELEKANKFFKDEILRCHPEFITKLSEAAAAFINDFSNAAEGNGGEEICD